LQLGSYKHRNNIAVKIIYKKRFFNNDIEELKSKKRSFNVKT